MVITQKIFSIKKLIAKQTDFMQQETLLQNCCKKIGVLTDRCPVAHPEIVGEGIEFDWGCSKLVYRSKPLSLKSSKEKFHNLVDTVLDKGVLILALLVGSNARRARHYILAYNTFEPYQYII